MSLPDSSVAAADPARAIEIVQGLVKCSLAEQWRQEHNKESWLEVLGKLSALHLDAMREPHGGGDNDPHEEACAACLKLARNLCVNSPHVQEYWWNSGLVDRVLRQLGIDAALPDERGATWCETVPGFLTNVIAGHQDLRRRACDAWIPAAAAIVCSMCSRRPELAFVLMQTLISNGQEVADTACDLTEAPSGVRQLVATDDGHCLLFVLSSLLFKGGLGVEREPASPKALEWAAVFFHTLWMWGGFASAYRGLKRIDVNRLHTFWCHVNGFPPGCATAPPGVLESLVSRLCTQVEVLSWLWHTIDGLQSKQLAQRMLMDPDFIVLVAEELAIAAKHIAQTHGLQWCPPPVTTEAAELLGLQVEDVDADALAASADSPAICDEQPRAEPQTSGACSALFGDLCEALLALSATDRKSGTFPVRLIGACLVVNVGLIDAIHKLRFGDLTAVSEPKRKPPPEAQEASRACRLVDQLRLCANVLYEDRRAQDFLRATGGLRVLLSNCYADDELPLLRETGVFAIRNATHANPTNQALGREMLQNQRRDGAAGPAPHPEEIGL